MEQNPANFTNLMYRGMKRGGNRGKGLRVQCPTTAQKPRTLGKYLANVRVLLWSLDKAAKGAAAEIAKYVCVSEREREIM